MQLQYPSGVLHHARRRGEGGHSRTEGRRPEVGARCHQETPARAPERGRGVQDGGRRADARPEFLEADRVAPEAVANLARTVRTDARRPGDEAEEAEPSRQEGRVTARSHLTHACINYPAPGLPSTADS